MYELEEHNEHMNDIIQQNQDYAAITERSAIEIDQWKKIAQQKESELLSIKLDYENQECFENVE